MTCAARELSRVEKGHKDAEVAQTIFDWANKLGLRRWYDAGRTQGSCYLGQEDEHGYLRPIAIWAYGSVSLQFGEMVSGKHPSFASEEQRRELQRRLNNVPGIAIGDDRIGAWPSVRIAALANPDVLQEFLIVIEWALDQMRSVEPG